MNQYERESLKELRAIRKELQLLNSKVMKPPEPPTSVSEWVERAEEQSGKQVSIDDLNAMLQQASE